jgi:alpha-L-rhamnosidase
MLLLGFVLGCAASGNAPTRLRLEYLEDPQGVDVLTPRFTWANTHGTRGENQTAYQILVVLAKRTVTVVWDSGKVMSNKNQNVKYAETTAPTSEVAIPLAADESYIWKVKYWDNEGVESDFSAHATFTTGLFAKDDWKGAKWIGVSDKAPGTQFRVAFNTTTPILRATAYCVGLGYYKMHVNDVKVSSHELGPFLTFEKRVYYDRCNIQHALYSMHYTACTMHYALCSMQYTACTMQHALRTMHYALHSYTTLKHCTHTHYAHTLHSYTTLIHSSHALQH